jgi:hypothetical protein
MRVAVNLDGVDTASFGFFGGAPPLASPRRFRSPAGGIKQADIRAEGERKTGRGLYTRRDDGATEFLIAHTRVILRSCARRISASDPLIQHQDKGRNVTEQAELTPVLTVCGHYFGALVRARR